MSIKIIMDSASDISQEQAKDLGLIIIPISVRFDSEEFLDGITMNADEFYPKLQNSKSLPQTSLINEYSWTEIFEEQTADGSEVVAITLSSKISGTYLAALSASKNFADKVFVVDSLNATFGEGALGIYASQLRDRNFTAKEIYEKLNEKKQDVCTFAVIDTLKYLKMGGRISSATAFIGATLAIKPIVQMIDGEIKMTGKAMGNKKGNALLNKKIEELGGIDFDLPWGYIWSGISDVNIQKYVNESQLFIKGGVPSLCRLGCTIGTHIGPGAVGVAFFRKKS